jgi:hypothetical protein
LHLAVLAADAAVPGAANDKNPAVAHGRGRLLGTAATLSSGRRGDCARARETCLLRRVARSSSTAGWQSACIRLGRAVQHGRCEVERCARHFWETVGVGRDASDALGNLSECSSVAR